MPDEYYPDMGGAETGAPTETPPEKESDAPESATALLPKTVLGGKDFKPGEEVVLKITHVYEDEVEVEYAPSKPTETETAPEPSADAEIDAMAMKGD